MVQVDPIISTLKAPGTRRLKLKCNTLLSHAAFTSNLRRSDPAAAAMEEEHEYALSVVQRTGTTGGAQYAPTMVRRCSLTLSNPR